MVGLNPPILLILTYGWTTSANHSLSHSKRDHSTIAPPIKVIARLMGENDLSAIDQSKDCDRPLSIVIYARIEKSRTDWIV
jgi:hypothetical protein